MRVITIIIFSLHTIIPLSVSCMMIQSSDGHHYRLTQKKIDSSLTLIKKQQLLKKYATHPYPDVPINENKESLDLFFSASNIKDSFGSFFYNLTQEQQDNLSAMTDEKRLNSPLMRVQIFSIYPPEIQNKLKEYFETDAILSTIQDKIIISQRIGKRKRDKKSSFKKNSETLYNQIQGFKTVPSCLISHQECRFNGNADAISIINSITNYPVLCAGEKKDNNNNSLHYLVEKVNEESCSLVTYDQYHQTLNNLPISHHNPITKTAFCHNGRYVATYSPSSEEYPYHTLLITTTPNPPDKLTHTTTMSLLINQKMTKCCFNPQSTIFVTGLLPIDHNSNAMLCSWDPLSGKCIQTLNSFGKKISIIMFNHDGTRMITTSEENDGVTYALWNSENPNHIIFKRGSLFADNKILKYPHFNHEKKLLIIPTQHSFIFSNSITGEIIKEIPTQAVFCHDRAHIVFNATNKLCLIHLISYRAKKRDITRLYKANGDFVTTVASRHTNTNGIGLFPNDQHIAITFNNLKMIKIPLLDEHSINCINWLKNKLDLVQSFALYHAYKAKKHKYKPSQDIVDILTALPIEPCNIRLFVAKYLLPQKSGPTKSQRKKRK